MDNILIMRVDEAYEKSKTSVLAEEIWKHKHLGESVDENDREYVSWLNSIPHFLEVAVKAGLGDLDVAFELHTPLGDYIDVALIGKSLSSNEDEFGRLLIVELKQWSSISEIGDKDYVEISIGNGEMDKRRHPVSQICEYKTHMCNNHCGIYRNGKVFIDTIAHLHNFIHKESLFTGIYAEWRQYTDKVFVTGDEDRLINYLQSTFSAENNPKMPDVLDDCGYIMDKAGFNGLKAALHGGENARMVKDQMAVVDCVKERLTLQKNEPHKEIIVVSGGPGTGKTIIGMHFIYDYAEIFNNGVNADGSVFCLSRSKTVKAMIDHECDREIVPYLNGIAHGQNLVVVDEAHRITEITSTLDQIFEKEIKLLVMLQDDHQIIRAGEEGTYDKIKAYVDERNENVAGENRIELTHLRLTIQKRCESLGKLLNGLDKMFFDQGMYDGKSISHIKVFERLSTMNAWIEHMAESSRAKLIAPFCWKWDNTGIRINDNNEIFQKPWNPHDDNDQVRWYYEANRADQVACIYTCQGLDFDDVAFIWWDDLVWDEDSSRWKADLNKSKDSVFKKDCIEAHLSQEEINKLFVNTYYVMLSRARNKMGIWFKDEATKRHVTEFLGLQNYTPSDKKFSAADNRNTVIDVNLRKSAAEDWLVGKVIYVNSTKKYAYIKGDDGIDYAVSTNTYNRLINPNCILVKGNRVSFSVWTNNSGKKYANDIALV